MTHTLASLASLLESERFFLRFVRTDDDYFSLTFHNLTQVDGRLFNPVGDPLHDNFSIPRQRWYVLGNISPYVRYYTVINRGFSSIDVLDAWTDWSVGDIDRDMLQIRVGRMKTPYTYEYMKVAENDLIAAERSVLAIVHLREDARGSLSGNPVMSDPRDGDRDSQHDNSPKNDRNGGAVHFA